MRFSWIPFLLAAWALPSFAQSPYPSVDCMPFSLYPELNDFRPELPSPFQYKGEVFVVAQNRDSLFALIPVTLGDERDIGPQLFVDSIDFPALARTGLHDQAELAATTTITGRSVEEITTLGRPNGLSYDGFMAGDEDILAVLKGDNQLVRDLSLTHPQLAEPLFHVLNMIEADLALDRWNFARHRWDHITCFYYNDRTVWVEVEDTKGGQLSIFDDGIQGAFYIQLRTKLSPEEDAFLASHYQHLAPGEMEVMKRLLTSLNTAEMEPQYIMRYGFYEGHTFWRTDPIAISFIFGIKSLPELDQALKGDLYEALTGHFVE